MNSSYGERSGRRPSGSGSARPCGGAARAAARRVLPVPPHVSRPRVPGTGRARLLPPHRGLARPLPAPPTPTAQLPLRASTAFAVRKLRTTPRTAPPRAPPPGPAGAARTCPGAARNAPARRGPAAAPRCRAGGSPACSTAAALPANAAAAPRPSAAAAPLCAALRSPARPPARTSAPQGPAGGGSSAAGEEEEEEVDRKPCRAAGLLRGRGGLRGDRTPRPVPPRSPVRSRLTYGRHRALTAGGGAAGREGCAGSSWACPTCCCAMGIPVVLLGVMFRAFLPLFFVEFSRTYWSVARGGPE